MQVRTALLYGVIFLVGMLSGCAALFELDAAGLAGEGAAAGEATLAAGRALAAGEGDFLGGRVLRATPGEISTLRLRGLPETSIDAQDMLLTRDLADTQITYLLESDRTAFSLLKRNERVYVSITNGPYADAGWVRRGRGNSLYFNDGSIDKIRSDLRGNTVYHYDLRNGYPVPLARTTLVGSVSRYEYAVWSPRTQSYQAAGFGIPNAARDAVDVYDVGGALVGRLHYTPITEMQATGVRRASLPNAIVLVTGSVLAFQVSFERTYIPVLPPSCEDANGSNLIYCRERLQQVLAATTENVRFGIRPLGGVSPEVGDKHRDPAFSERPN